MQEKEPGIIIGKDNSSAGGVAEIRKKEMRERKNGNEGSGIEESKNEVSENEENEKGGSEKERSDKLACCEKDHYERMTAALDRFVAVLPKGDPLAKRKKISLSELRDRSFLLLDETTELFSQAQKLCRRAGFEPPVAYQGVRVDTILAMTASGLGVSLLMEQTVPEKKDRGIVTVVLEETCESRLVFARKKSRKTAPAVNVFWEFLKEKIKEEKHQKNIIK